MNEAETEDLDEAKARAGRRRLQPYHWTELAGLPKREPIIKGVLDCGAMSVVYGASGEGKTFFATNLAWHVTLGWELFGHKVTKGGAYYLSAEGGPGSIERRLAAFRTHHNINGRDAPLYVYPSDANLCDPDADTGALIAEVSAIAPSISLIVVDTLSRVMAGGNENAPDDMGALVANVDRIRNETGAHVLIVHHTGKDTARGARGHSLLRAATDTEIEVARDQATNIVTATVTKQRDHEPAPAMTFKLEPVEIGMDEDEERITSRVVVPVEATARLTGPRLNPRQRRAMDILHTLAADSGRPAPDTVHYPPGAIVVPVDAWREHLFKAGVLDAGAANPREPFRRLKNGLTDAGAIREWDGNLWAPNTGAISS